MATQTSRTRRIARRIKRVWGELDYAQRRLFEMRTGVPVRRGEYQRISRSVDELNRLYAA